MSIGRAKTKKDEKLIGLGLLILIIVGIAWGGALAEEEGADELGQGRRWLPRLTFPPSDPSKEAGYIPLVGRDFSLEYLYYTFYLSSKRGLEVTKRDSDFYLRIGGRMYLDFSKYIEDKNDLGSDGIGLRTFLLEADGKFTEKWHFRLSLGGLTNGGKFDTGGSFLDDAYASYVGTKTVWLFGQHQEPFSLEQTTSSLATTFMERALPNALVPGGSVGTSFLTTGDRWTLSAGLFGEDLAGGKDIKNQGVGLTSRFTFRSLRSDDNFYHLGASFSFRKIAGGDTIYYRARPESGMTDVRYVNTGDLSGVDYVVRMGVEMAFDQGPVSVQAEYIGAYLNRESGNDDLLFRGWYLQVSWFPTGESRRYIPSEGIFGYPRINSRYGAVELAARYSMIDLTDGTVKGGKERNLAFGANWYISSKIRLMANYILVFADDNATDNGSVVGDDKPRILQLRLHFRF